MGVLVAAQIVPGIQFTPKGLILATLLLGILNAIVRPIMIVVSLPLVLLSFGLFLIVINALLLYWVGHLKEFHVASFMDAFWGSLIISLISLVLNALMKSDGSRPRQQRRSEPPPPPPPSRRDDGQGPIIDV